MVNTTKETKRKIKKNQTIKFTHASDLTGQPLILVGTVLGFGDAVRKMWPEEMGEAPDDYLLVKRVVHGIDSHYVVIPNDVDSIISPLFEKEV